MKCPPLLRTSNPIFETVFALGAPRRFREIDGPCTCQIAITDGEWYGIYVGLISINPISIQFPLTWGLSANAIDVNWLAKMVSFDVVLCNCVFDGFNQVLVHGYRNRSRSQGASIDDDSSIKHNSIYNSPPVISKWSNVIERVFGVSRRGISTYRDHPYPLWKGVIPSKLLPGWACWVIFWARLVVFRVALLISRSGR